jgi:hypothetical protein
MDSKKVLYSPGANDECYTPRYGVKPVLKYLKAHHRPVTFGGFDSVIKKPVIWCPFDTEDSEFVKVFEANGYEVIKSHIDTGQDFYEYEPEESWDLLISNPPFTKKREIFERALSFGKPIALLMSNTWLNDSASKSVFRKSGRTMQLLMFDDRIHFDDRKRITFSSSYFCSDFLPRDLILYGKLEKKE